MKPNTAPSALLMIKERRCNTFLRNCLLIGLMAGSAIAQTVPDLTNGGVPSTNNSVNLGPTGMRGWVYSQRQDSSLSRQIMVYNVDAGSPAAGILAPDDVILGASGTGAVPTNFTSDARRSFADAINGAEARTPATLKLLRWRAGVTETVELTLQTMGAYSATAPYNCPKSALILQHGLAALMAGETPGIYNLGALSLLAAYDPADPNNAARMARAEAEVIARIPTQNELNFMLTATNSMNAGSTWERGHTLILFCEYFLLTGDTRVLPAIRSYAVLIARNQTLWGTMSHKFSDPWLDGSLNGPMGSGYGPVNSAAMPCWLGLLLAKQCGLTDQEIDPAIERASRFFAYYMDKGVIPYGEHIPYVGLYENNGKMSLAALAYGLQPNRAVEARHFTRMAVTSAREREIGHTGTFFQYLWSPLGAAAGGPDAAAFHFSEIRWMLDLNRSWNGLFIYDSLYGEGARNGDQYGVGTTRFRMSTAALLTYALPLRNLHITGKDQDPARWLTPAELADSSAALEYQAAGRSVSELLSDLASWSSVIRRNAADQLLTFTPNPTTIDQLTAIATDTNANPGARIEACYVLGNINDEATAGARATTLAGLLTDPVNHVRYMSAEAMRSISNGYRMPHLNTILAAAVSTAKPLFPLDDEDPLHMAHGRLCLLLFNSSDGVIPGANVNLAPKHLLYPAIKAVARNPIGMARGSLSSIYDHLSEEEMRIISGPVVDAARDRSPADRMFSRSGRVAALNFLKKFDVAEGVPVALAMMRDDGAMNEQVFNVLDQYAGSSKTVVPDPDVEAYMRELIGNGYNVDSAQELLAIIAADTNPTPLVPLKSIQSVTADNPSLTLPSIWTTLRVASTDHAEGDGIFTWRKIHGAGNVTFAPNGTTDSENTVALFDGTPGQYLFEVTMTDSRGLTEVSSTVAVTLNGTGGTLPSNSPPVANNQLPTVLRATPTLIKLTGTDPEGYPMTYSVINAPANGRLSGEAPNLVYTPDFSYLGADSFIFQVMDSEGQISPPATVSITITENAGIPTAIYEPFNYPVGGLHGASGTSETGFSGPWASQSSILVAAPSLSHGILPTLGGSISSEGAATLGGTRAISPAALADFGLLNNGSTLWFSAMIGIGEGENTTNSKVGFALANSGFPGGFNFAIANEGTQMGSGLGVFLGRFGDSDGLLVATQFRDSSFGSQTAPNVYGTTPSHLTKKGAGAYRFVVGKIQWGAADDTIELYFPDEDLNLGPVQSSLTVDVDQSTYDTLTWTKVGKTLMDEIRFGPTYYSVLAGNAPMAADTAAPGPVPMAFHHAPTPISPSAIRMEAVPVLDPSGVEYYFTCTAGGGNDSGWQSSPIYTDTGLTPGVLYTYTVKARDNSPALNETSPSPALSATINAQATLPDFTGMTRITAESIIATLGMNLGTITLVNDPNLLEGTVTGQSPAGQQTIALGSTVNLTAVGPDITAPNPNPASFASAPTAVDFFSITMTATTGTDPTGVQYLFTETSGNPGGTSSGWQDSPVYTDVGLEDGTQYTYTITLGDKSPNANQTTPSAPASASTPALPDPIIAYWDGGNGSWGDVTKWSTVSGATTPDPSTVPDFVDTAIFNTVSGGSTAQDVALDGDRSVASLIYRSGTPHIVANTSGTTSRTLTIGSGGIMINNTVGGNFEIGRSALTLGAVNIALGANQAWTNNDNNSITVSGIISGNAQLTKDGPGALALGGANSFTGGFIINAGSVSSPITFNDSFLGSAFNAQVTLNAGGTLSLNRNNITGTLTMNGGNLQSGNGFGSTWNGSIILQSTSYFMNGGAGSVTVNAVISGPGGLSRTAGGNDTRVILKSANTFTGDTVWAVTNARLELDHASALQNSTLDTASSLVSSGGVERGIRTTVSALTLGGLSGNKDLKSLFATNATAGGYNNLTSLTLNPGLGKTPNYSGGIANGATTMTLTKTGQGTQTLSGINIYTGTTTVSQGTLALLGGSHASPITVAGGASLGFTLGSPTTSTSSVHFGAGTVAITGTPTLESYTLMTADGGFTGTPALSDPIPGYALTVEGTQLKLIVFQANNAPIWASNPVVETNATEGSAYSATLADDAFDTDGDPLTFAKLSGSGWLNVAPDGTLSGTPTQPNVGPNSFTVSVTDGMNAPVSATLNITVIKANDAPVFLANPIIGTDATEDEPYTATLAGSATDEDGDPLTYAKVSGPAWLSVAPNGALSGTPATGDVGANVFTISASDGIAAPVEATLNITVIAKQVATPAIIYWDGGNGTWGDPAQWSTVSGATTPDPTAAPSTLDSAIFNTTSGGTTAQDVALDGDRSVNSLIFRSGTPHIVGNTTGIDARTLTIGSGGLTLDNTVGGNFEIGRAAATLGAVNIALGADQSWTNNDNNFLTVNGIISGNSQLTIEGTGQIRLNGANSFTGGVIINGGNVYPAVTFNDSFLGSATDAQVTVNAGGKLGLNRNNIAGTMTLNGGIVDSTNGFGSTWNGSIILQSTSYFLHGGAGGITVNAEISGSGGLSRLTGSNDTRLILKNANTFTGDTVWGVTNARLELDHALALQNSTLDTANSLVSAGNVERGIRITVSALTFGGLSGEKDLKSLFATNATAGGYDNLAALTLNTGTETSPEYTGGIANGATGMTLTKTGAGIQTLSGTNTYTGLTTISEGILALVGGSQASPITVEEGASLGFTLDSPTTSTSSVNFGTGTVAITGTPTLASYTLMTADGGFTGTTVLSAPIPGYELAVQGTQLKLLIIQTNAAPVWATNPIIGNDATEDAPYTATLAGSATDADGDPLTFAKLSGPAWLSVAPNGTLSGTPTQSDVGENSFTVSVSDGIAAPVEATLNITVINVNDAPVFVANPIIGADATEDAPYAATLAGSAIDEDGDPLTYGKVSGPAWLSVAPNGTLSGTPTQPNVGANSFIVSVSDGIAAPVTATLNITVINVNDAPVFTANPIIGADATEGEPYAATLAGSATDEDGDPLTFAKLSGPAWLSVAPNGALSGTPSQSDVGVNAFTVSVSDGIAAPVEAALNITVKAANSAPVFLTNPIIAADASEESAYTGVTLAGQATDPDEGDTITFSKVSGPEWLAVASDGALSGTPPAGSAGLNSFVVRATDSASATADATLEITVSNLPLPWIATDIGTGMLAGSTSFDAGTFTQAGSGTISGKSDKLRYTYQTLTGDGEITARITNLQNTATTSRVGVMIRDSLAANSRHYFMGMSGSNSFRWVRRTATDGNTNTNISSSGTVPDTWVRIVRSGTNISLFKSANGISWTTVQSNNSTTLGDTCYIGLAVCSGSGTTLNTSQFSNVSVTP